MLETYGLARPVTDPPENVMINIASTDIECVATYKYLGVTLDSKLTFIKHIESIGQNVFLKIRTLDRISYFVNRETAIYLYKSLVLSQLEHADIIYDGLSQADSNYLQRLQNYGLQSILHCTPGIPTADLHELALKSQLNIHMNKHVCVQVYKGIKT